MHSGVRSDRLGVLCGIGFGSTHGQCRVRDEMVEWSANNGPVIRNHRFLQLRDVRVLGLSSQALRLVARRVVGIPRLFAAIDRSGRTDRHLVATCDGGICDTFAVAYPELAAPVPFCGRKPCVADGPQVEAPLPIHFAEHDEGTNADREDYGATHGSTARISAFTSTRT